MLEQGCGEGQGVSPVHSEGGKRSGGEGSRFDVFQKQKCGRYHS